MFERDYILEIVSQFAEALAESLGLAVSGEDGGCERVEQDIAGLLDLDPQVALSLSPDSLVQMMVLSGIGDSIASHMCYGLEHLADVYERDGKEDLAIVRRAQAEAVAQSFGCDPNVVPAELAEVDERLFSK